MIHDRLEMIFVLALWDLFFHKYYSFCVLVIHIFMTVKFIDVADTEHIISVAAEYNYMNELYSWFFALAVKKN